MFHACVGKSCKNYEGFVYFPCKEKLAKDGKEKRWKKKGAHVLKMEAKNFIVQSVGSNKCGNPGVREKNIYIGFGPLFALLAS